MAENCSIPYGGSRSVRNATIPYAEATKAKADQKVQAEQNMADYMRERGTKNKPKTTKDLGHEFNEEHHSPTGAVNVKVKTTTKRKSH